MKTPAKPQTGAMDRKTRSGSGLLKLAYTSLRIKSRHPKEKTKQKQARRMMKIKKIQTMETNEAIPGVLPYSRKRQQENGEPARPMRMMIGLQRKRKLCKFLLSFRIQQ